MVKRHKKTVTLAIGDGANDVSMIKSEFLAVRLPLHRPPCRVADAFLLFSSFISLGGLCELHRTRVNVPSQAIVSSIVLWCTLHQNPL